MSREAIDDLLADYLKGKKATPEASAAVAPPRPLRTRDPRREPTEEPPRVELPTSAPAAAPPHAVTSRPPAARKPVDGELQELLGSYLEVGNAEQDFSVPRSPEVDDLLRLYVLEKKDVSKDLESTLREHVRAVRETAEQRRVTVEASPRGPSAEWSQTVAAQLRDTQDIDERVRNYATAVAHEEERTHAFRDDHESTIKGVPPPNAPPIPLGSDLARQIKDQLKKA